MGEVQIASPGPPTRARQSGVREEEKERVRASKLERQSERPERGPASRYMGAQWRPLRDPGPKRVEILARKGYLMKHSGCIQSECYLS